jgi:protein AroM
MKRCIGTVTIGQAPRVDVTPIFEKYLPSDVELIQVGVLDGLTKGEIESDYKADDDTYTLTSRLTNGESVTVSRSKILKKLKQKVTYLEESGCSQILVLCTGELEGIKTESSKLIEPDQLLTPIIVSLIGNQRLGVMIPLEEQKEVLAQKWSRYGIQPEFVAASPYDDTMERFQEAACELRQKQVDIIVLDCMGYDELIQETVREYAKVPVILSNALMVKILTEII